MEMERIVDVQVSIAARPITQTGFETPLFIAPHTVFDERFRIYTSSQAAVEDGFDAESDVVRALTAFFSGNFAPAQVIIGTRQFEDYTIIIPTGSYDATAKFAIKVVAKDSSSKVSEFVEYTPSVSEDQDAVATALAAAIEGDVALGSLVSASAVGGVITVTAKTGARILYLGKSIQDEDAVDVVFETTNMEDIADTLTAITQQTNDYFFITSHSRSEVDILQLAAYAEANKKIYAVATYDADILNPAVIDDIASQLKDLQYELTMLIAQDENQVGEYHECTAIGEMAALQAGSSTLHGKTLQGVTVSKFSTTQEETILGKNANIYTMIAGVGFFLDGKMSDGTFFDVQRGRLWLETRMEEDIFLLIKQKADLGMKIPYTDEGVGMVVTVMERRLQNAVDVNFLAATPRFKVKPPLVANIPTIDKVNRFLPDIPFEATLAGAIHRIKIKGIVTV